MIDQNPFANNTPPQPVATPQSQNPTIANPTQGVSQMLQALLAGNDAYKKANPMAATPALAPGQQVPGAMGPSSIGSPNTGPMPLMGGPTPPAAMTGGLGSAPTPPTLMPMPRPAGAPMQPPFPAGPTNPMEMDPVTSALMSPIPGMTNG